MRERGLRNKVKEFSKANNVRALSETVLTLTGYALFMHGVYIGYTSGNWLLYAGCCVVAALFMVKIFTIQHDCGHESFFTKTTYNTWVGRFFALITTMPFTAWRDEHNVHHGHVADIEQIGHGDVLLLTIEQYHALSPLGKGLYRTLRHPLFFLTIAPFFYFFVKSKYPGIKDHQSIMSVILTAFFVVLVYGSFAFYFGFWTAVFVFVPAAYLGGIMGLALFYLQHDYPGAQWFMTEEWEHEHASLAGSSLMVLPQPLDWFSHSIGYHHIHHLDSHIPGYRLKECFRNVPELRENVPLSWNDIRYSFRMKLWSHEKGGLVTFSELAVVKK